MKAGMLFTFISLLFLLSHLSKAPVDLAMIKEDAKQGDPRAQFCLAQKYYYGNSAAPDPDQAFSWYQKAAVLGYARAQFRLGVLYYNGVGVSQDFLEAAAWYNSAARQRHAGAAFNLGLLYLNGIGVLQDYEKAYI